VIDYREAREILESVLTSQTDRDRPVLERLMEALVAAGLITDDFVYDHERAMAIVESVLTSQTDRDRPVLERLTEALVDAKVIPDDADKEGRALELWGAYRANEANEPPEVVFRQLDGPYWEPAAIWQVELHIGSDIGYPAGLAWVWEKPNTIVMVRLEFVLVPDHFRRRGFATRLIEACRERWPDLVLSGPISEEGAALRESLQGYYRDEIDVVMENWRYQASQEAKAKGEDLETELTS
jgi:hypothetical protein